MTIGRPCISFKGYSLILLHWSPLPPLAQTLSKSLYAFLPPRHTRPSRILELTGFNSPNRFCVVVAGVGR